MAIIILLERDLTMKHWKTRILFLVIRFWCINTLLVLKFTTDCILMYHDLDYDLALDVSESGKIWSLEHFLKFIYLYFVII